MSLAARIHPSPPPSALWETGNRREQAGGQRGEVAEPSRKYGER